MQNMQYPSKTLHGTARGAWLLALLALLLFPAAAQAGQLGASSGVALFSELDGSSVDADGAADGTLTLDRLDLAGNAELRVDVIPARIQVDGDVELSGSSAIRPAPGIGAPNLELQATGSIRLTGNSAIVADAPQGGDLVLCAGGDLVLAGNATVSASAVDLQGAGGSVYLEAGGRLVLADAAVRVLANGASGGAVTLASCASGDAGPGSSNRNAAVALDGGVEAVGADGVGGTVEVEARQGEVAFGPGLASIDARGTTADGSVALTSAGRVVPAAPPVQPAPVILTDSPSDEACDCSPLRTGELVVAADVDSPAGLAGALFTFSGRVVQSTVPVVDWQWVLTDGRTFSGQQISVSFPEPGLYGAELTAVDADGTVLVAETGVVVFDPATQAPPELNLPDQVGDLDLDGLITLEDAHRVAKHAGELELLTGDALAAADVDLDGLVSDRDALLLGQAVAAGASLPTVLLPERGAPGSRVRLISPELLDPTALIQIQVGDSRPVQTPLRPVRGYATFFMPLDATVPGSIRVEPGPVEVKVLKDGVLVETLIFQVEEPQPLPADPKAELISLLDDYVSLLEVNRQALAGLLDYAAVDGDEEELLLATFTAAQQDAAAKVAELKEVLERPDGEDLAALFFIAANTEGYAEFRQRLDETLATQTALVAQFRIAAASGSVDIDQVVALLCAVNDASELLSTGSDILGWGCDLLLAAAVGTVFIPADGPTPIIEASTLFAWAALCGKVEVALELALLVNDLVGGIEPDLRFEGSPTSPGPGESVELRAELEITGLDDVCTFGANKARDELIDELAEEAIERLIRKKAVLRTIKKAAEALDTDLFEELEDRLEAAVLRTINSTAIGDMLDELTGNVCDVFQFGAPVLDDLSQIMQGPDPNVGDLTFNSDGTATYTCPTDPSSTANEVTFTATRQLCGDEPAEETVTVSCETKPVTITIGDNGFLNDDIFEVRIEGETVLTSSAPTRAISTTVELAVGDHVVEMIGRAAPDGIGTYYITFSGATVIGGDATSGSDLTPGVVKTFIIRVQ